MSISIVNLKLDKVRVEQMTSPRSYNPVANQFMIYTKDGVYFQSYRSIIAFIPNKGNGASKGLTVLDERYWDYSRTTSKYRNEFLRELTADTKRKIKEGTYILANLN